MAPAAPAESAFDRRRYPRAMRLHNWIASDGVGHRACRYVVARMRGTGVAATPLALRRPLEPTAAVERYRDSAWRRARNPALAVGSPSRRWLAAAFAARARLPDAPPRALPTARREVPREADDERDAALAVNDAVPRDGSAAR